VIIIIIIIIIIISKKVFKKVFKYPKINMYLVFYLNTNFEYLTQHWFVRSAVN